MVTSRGGGVVASELRALINQKANTSDLNNVVTNIVNNVVNAKMNEVPTDLTQRLIYQVSKGVLPVSIIDGAKYALYAIKAVSARITSRIRFDNASFSAHGRGYTIYPSVRNVFIEHGVNNINGFNVNASGYITIHSGSTTENNISQFLQVLTINRGVLDSRIKPIAKSWLSIDEGSGLVIMTESSLRGRMEGTHEITTDIGLIEFWVRIN